MQINSKRPHVLDYGHPPERTGASPGSWAQVVVLSLLFSFAEAAVLLATIMSLLRFC